MSYIKSIIEGIIEENPSLTKKAIESALFEKMAERLELAREEVAFGMFTEEETDEEEICEDCEEEWDDEEVTEAKDEDEDEDEDEEDEDEDEEVEEARARKDYDGDGKIESGTQEYLGSRDRAIKRAMARREEIEFDETYEPGEKYDEKKHAIQSRTHPHTGKKVNVLVRKPGTGQAGSVVGTFKK